MRLSSAEALLWRAQANGPQTLPFIDCAQSLWLVLNLQGPLDGSALQKSLEAVLERHDVLRSRFTLHGGHPVRSISPRMSADLRVVDGRDTYRENPHEILPQLIRPHLDHQFDLQQGPLLRSALVRTAEDEHILAIAIHHIACDRWSIRLLEQELKHFYTSYKRGETPTLLPLKSTYADYVVAQWQLVGSERGQSLSNFWLDKLRNRAELSLAPNRSRESEVSADSDSGTTWFSISPEDTKRLVVLSRQSRATLATTMLAVFIFFLNRMSDVSDVCVGVPLSDRRRPEYEALIGLFMNAVAVRTRIPGGASFVDLLGLVRHGLVEACLHQDLPYGQLLRLLPDLPPYRVLFNFMPSLPPSDGEFDGLSSTRLTIPMDPRSVADLSLHIQPRSDTLLCRLLYKKVLTTPARGQRFAEMIQGLITAILKEPECRLAACLVD